ncbi:carboxypeptidase regulatory-like domain-containing protein, partial [Actinoplanes sp. NPDC051633]
MPTGLLVVTGTALAVSATPVAAASPAIRIERVSSDNVRSGESVRVRFRVTNNNERGTDRAFVAVSGGLRCTAGCAASANLKAGQSKNFTATVVAPRVRPGEETGLNLAVTVRIGVQTGFANKLILVRGADKPSTAVSRVSGRVRDAD